MKKVSPDFRPFRTYLRVQHNISDVFERFSISSCDNKNEDAGNLQEKTGCVAVGPVTNYLLISTLLETRQICTSMIMKKAGHFSVPSNPTAKCTAIFLASLNDFLLDYALDAGNLEEKVWPHACPMCEKIFPYLCLLDTVKYVPQ